MSVHIHYLNALVMALCVYAMFKIEMSQVDLCIAALLFAYNFVKYMTNKGL